MNNQLPVVIIGAGPVGLAAAAHLYTYNQPFKIIEKGSNAGSNVLEWGHVRLFSPWEYNVDQAAKALLKETGWEEPDANHLPTGKEFVEEYLHPLSSVPQIREHLLFESKVFGIVRKNSDKMKSKDREQTPFILYVERNKKLEKIEAKAVIDTSGTWDNPNPPFADGIWRRLDKGHIHTHIPDIMGTEQEQFKNKHVAVIGSGHSAFHSLIDLAELKRHYPKTNISWILRKQHLTEAYGGEEKDELEARGALGSQIHRLVDQGAVNVYSAFYVDEIEEVKKSFTIYSDDRQEVKEVDEIIVNTGSRPDFSFLHEIRLDIDPAVESTKQLAPLIDPNVHSCGTVRPHGEEELRQSEPHFYIAGVKSYGRAPTFLMATGYEQVRSIAAYLSGDLEEAKKVKLKLPETGVCCSNIVPNNKLAIPITPVNGGGCCG